MLKEHATRFDEVALLPGSGGVFEVVLDGEPIFSKRETGRFPEYDEINEPLKARSAARA